MPRMAWNSKGSGQCSWPLPEAIAVAAGRTVTSGVGSPGFGGRSPQLAGHARRRACANFSGRLNANRPFHCGLWSRPVSQSVSGSRSFSRSWPHDVSGLGASLVPIDGVLRTGLARLQPALKLYHFFLTEQSNVPDKAEHEALVDRVTREEVEAAMKVRSIGLEGIPCSRWLSQRHDMLLPESYST